MHIFHFRHASHCGESGQHQRTPWDLAIVSTRGYYRPKRNSCSTQGEWATLMSSYGWIPILTSTLFAQLWACVSFGFSANFSPWMYVILPGHDLYHFHPSPSLCNPADIWQRYTFFLLSHTSYSSLFKQFTSSTMNTSFKSIVPKIKTFSIKSVYSDRDRNYNLKLLQFQ